MNNIIIVHAHRLHVLRVSRLVCPLVVLLPSLFPSLFDIADAGEVVWDNNQGKDFHVSVSNDPDMSSGSTPFTHARGTTVRWGGAVAATMAHDPYYDNVVPAPTRPTSSVPKPAAKRGSAARLLRTPASKGPADIGMMAAFLMESLAGAVRCGARHTAHRICQTQMLCCMAPMSTSCVPLLS